MYHRLLLCIVCCGLRILTRKKRKGVLTRTTTYVLNVYIGGDDIYLINGIILLRWVVSLSNTLHVAFHVTQGYCNTIKCVQWNPWRIKDSDIYRIMSYNTTGDVHDMGAPVGCHVFNCARNAVYSRDCFLVVCYTYYMMFSGKVS